VKKNRFVVIHFEDEPWNYSFVMLGLREIILERLHGEVTACHLQMGELGPGDFPSCSKLSWKLNGADCELVYWLVETAEQVTDGKAGILKDVSDADAYIIDVMRPGVEGRWLSIWRRTLQALTPHVRSLDTQVRLFTAFDEEAIQEADNIDTTLDDELRSLQRPPIIEKSADFTELLDFIVSRCEGVFSK
jgi:hypothetical protein